MKSYINGKLYFKFYKDNKLTSLSYFVYLNKSFKHKRFKLKETGLCRTSFYKHFNVLYSYGLIKKDKDYFILTSSDQIKSVYGGKSDTIFLLPNIKTLKEIQYFLKTLPIISNLCNQKKAIDKKNHFCTIKTRIDANTYVSIKELKSYKKFTKKNDLKISSLQLSNKGILNSVSKSSFATSLKYKNFLSGCGLVSFFRDCRWVNLKTQTRAEFNYLINEEAVPYYSKFRGSYVLIDLPNRCTLLFK